MSGDLDSGHKELVDLAQARMPFGKYQGRRLIDLPENYLVWFANQGFPEGQLGRKTASGLRNKAERPRVPF